MNVISSRRVFFRLFMALCMAGAAMAVHAQKFPSRPLKIIVGSPPGALGDILARMVGTQWTASTGQAALIDNRLGAAGIIAADAVAKAPGDGTTVLLAPDSVLVVNPFVYPKLSYNPERDFKGVALLGKASLMLAVSPNLKVNSMAEFVRLAKARPLSINYGTGGAGHPTHVIMELIANRLGLQLTHVPYKGTSPAMQALVAGDIGAVIVGMAEGLPQVKAGKAIPLAASGPAAKEIFPRLPELRELHPDLDVSVWFGIFAPASTPGDIVTALNSEINKGLGQPDVKQRLGDFGLAPQPGTPESLDQLARSDRARFGPLIKSLGLVAE